MHITVMFSRKHSKKVIDVLTHPSSFISLALVFFLIIQTVHRINRAMTISAMAEATTPPPTAAPLTPDLPPVFVATVDAINRNFNIIMPQRW
jgi:hypothetical protein